VKVAGYVVLKFVGFDLFGGGDDSGYYHAYAVGLVHNVANVWPVILRSLNELGLYNREIVSYFIFFIGLVFVPFLVFSVSIVSGASGRQRHFLISCAFLSAYPTLFFFSLDIYRDVVMVAIFLISLLFVKRIDGPRFTPFSMVLFFLLCYVLFLFRPYLGVAMFFSYVLLFVYYKTSDYLFSWLVFYVLALMLGQALGLFDAITSYRGLDGFSEGGATMNIGLHGRDPLTFLGLYFYSFTAQVLGVYFPNASSVLVFLTESVPFIFLLCYVAKHRGYMNGLCKYLVIFFVVYSTIWVVGNDNLGTAVRLRMPSYIAILICFLVIRQRRLQHVSGVP